VDWISKRMDDVDFVRLMADKTRLAASLKVANAALRTAMPNRDDDDDAAAVSAAAAEDLKSE
jgi:hypothetical protein